MYNNTTTIALPDTLTDAYSDRWAGAETASEANMLMQFMSSNDLIFVVLTVSLIIWFVLAYYLVRIDRKIDALEEKYSEKK